ncbi:MAG: hypothetical protein M1826_004214 [Phylliscum demangeonii]|nr:MAG: hypothetical protein M1826_004214 [Phylliscum demangeonii]
MPHKHRRNKSKADSMAPRSAPKPQRSHSQPPSKLPKAHYDKDDTPKAFARLMRFQAVGRYPSGADDGSADRPKGSKKRKRGAGEQPATAIPENGVKASKSDAAVPKILPGERLGDFAARVDVALPVSSSLIAKGSKARNTELELKPRQTKLEKKMQRMQAEWRKEDLRRREKRQEEMEERGDDDDDAWLDSVPVTDDTSGARRKKGKAAKGSRSRREDDPWEQVRVARNEPPRSLHDVVQAPPKFTNLPRQPFRVANGARVDVLDVPRAAGSLRRREELGVARREVLDSYKLIMQGKQGISSLSK